MIALRIITLIICLASCTMKGFSYSLSNLVHSRKLGASTFQLSMVSTAPKPSTKAPLKNENMEKIEKRNVMEQISAAGFASAAVVAAAAVNSAVG